MRENKGTIKGGRKGNPKIINLAAKKEPNLT